MDVRQKIREALDKALQAEYVRLEEADGISGFIVSSKFQGMPTLDRQALIEEALTKAKPALTAEERRQVLMIAGLTPVEYESVGARIRVHRVREVAGGKIEILLHGGLPDAEYVRGALNNEKGVSTTEPEKVTGAPGILMTFRAAGKKANPLTKEKVLRILRQDPYIEVLPNA
jgi:hypothetical protein